MNKTKFEKYIIKNLKDTELRNLVVKNSKFFKSDRVDVLESIRMAQWENTEITNCHENCQKVFSDGYRDLRLFNGFVTYEHNFYPIYHTWIVCRNKIIDPTYIIDDQKKNRLAKKFKLNNKYDFNPRLEYYGFDEPKIIDRLYETNGNWINELTKIQARK